jgi:hypothetical protein
MWRRDQHFKLNVSGGRSKMDLYSIWLLYLLERKSLDLTTFFFCESSDGSAKRRIGRARAGGCVKKIAEFQLCYMLHSHVPSYSTEKKREIFHGAKIKAPCGDTEKRNNDA